MNIGGFMKQSFVDFPENISAVIFTNGCNLNCWYCHNRVLIKGDYKAEFALENILEFLKARKGFIEGVVISGGEPTLQSDLLEVIKKIKALDLKVKLDTNGTCPNVLKEVLPYVDYVAMDIKNSFDNYSKTVGKVNIQAIKESIELLQKSKVNFEFRTTFASDLTLDDIKKIAQELKGTKNYYLQTYNPQTDNSPPAHTPFEFNQALMILKQYIPNAKLR